MPKNPRTNTLLAFVGVFGGFEPPSRLEVFWGYIRILRIVNFLGITLLVILSTLVSHPHNFPLVDALLGGIGVALSASAGSVMNDVHDFPTNRLTRGRENRVLVKELMSESNAWKYYWVLCGLSLTLFLLINWTVFFVGIGCSAALFAYSWKVREFNGFLSNVIIAGVMGIASGFGGLIAGDFTKETFFLLTFGFLITLAREFVLDIGDIDTDRRANLKTLPLTMGIERTYTAAVATLIFLVVYSYLPIILGVYDKNYGFLVTGANSFSLVMALAMVRRRNPGLQRSGLKIAMFAYPLITTISELFL